MNQYIVSASSTARDFVPIMMCVHDLLGQLPVTARSRDHQGVRIEGGRVVDDSYTGPILEEVICDNVVKRVTPPSGSYRGIPVIVAPIRDDEGNAIGAMGVVDVTGIFDLAGLMEQHAMIKKQVCGSDPCPRPEESTGAKR
ncbi:MAG: DUF2111 domain-containing protein [Methanomicrobiaceae archaeon]|nr:DUF2111 domain-containing protein [Methanomicrobiaceae archaeon]MDD5420491.1 DUF2111 domain-containing protein [Methanomicrobiaceae archaeon]